MMPSRTTTLPLCRSDFLQDVTIVLGRLRKGFKYQIRSFECEVTDDWREAESTTFECLTIRCNCYFGSIFSLHLWEDQTAQVLNVGATSKEKKRSKVSFDPDISEFTPEGIFEALKQSVSGGRETESLRRIWEHDGEVVQEP